MQSNLDSLYKTNKKFENDGVDLVVRPAGLEDGKEVLETSFRVRRFNGSNPRVKAAMAAYHKPYARQIEMGTLPIEKADELAMRLFIDVCLVSWKGVLDEKGQPIEFTKENAFKLFKSLPDLFITLQQYASDFQNFKDEVGHS